MSAFLDFWATVPPTLILSGRKTLVRTPRLQDWPEWSRLRARSWAFLQPWEPSWTLEALTRPAFRRRLKQYAIDWQHDAGYSFLIFARDLGDTIVGGIALSNVQRGVSDCGTIGYWMGEEFAGRGYMREAVQLVLDFAFDKLALHRVEAVCLENNDRSRALLEKSGFRYEGLARGLLKIDGTWRDHLSYAILREDTRGAG